MIKLFKESQTSFPEQAIFFYLRQVTTAFNRYMIEPRTEIDIYLPEYKIGIEYDGIYFHKGEKAEQREKRKNEILNKQGIVLIRVKEVNNKLENKITKNIIYSKASPSNKELTETIKKLFIYINNIISISLDIDIDVARDCNNIYEQYIENEKSRSLLLVNPKVASEWHHIKNGKMLPEFFAANSNKQVWWICEKGHEWKAAINSRNKGSGCPYCAGQKAILGYNDLNTVNPRLALQWHPSKNGNLSSNQLTENSNKMIWWQCEKGHEWKAIVYDRKNGCNCPICSGHQILIGYNDLATVNTELALQWHPIKNGVLTPQDVTAGSDKKVWWKCKNGHEWQAVISSRNAGYGCPYCAGEKLIVGYNDLDTVNPTLALEWHPTKNHNLSPKNVMAGTHKKAWWLGKCGHEWEASIGSRNAGRGCPYCASQKLLVGFNDLASINPQLASEWNTIKNGNLTAKDVMPSSNKKVWWICKKGHEWENYVNTRNSGNGCPYCANQMVWVGYNDLATLNPSLASEWHPIKNGVLTPFDFVLASNKKVWWLGKCGHEWESVISSRNKGVGCPYCAEKKVLCGYNDLKTINPQLAEQWHPTKNGQLKPSDVTRSSNKKVWWMCSQGHEWEATVNKRNAGRNCPYCARKARSH